jgi:AcrR family transcriptional regulator
MLEEEPKRGRGRPRRAGADEEILSVALAMLREKGYHDLTVDAVAETAGVAKTTIYRRWPSKGALVAAALAPAKPLREPSVDGGSIEADVSAILRDVVDLLRLGGNVQSDPELYDVLRTAIAPDRAHIADIVGRSVQGDSTLVADLLIAPLLLGRTEVDAIVNTVLHGALA